MTTASSDEFVPAGEAEASQWLADNSASAARPVFPVGGRTALHYGYVSPQAGVTLCTSQLNAVVDYPARDMTITVGAGIRINDLAEILRPEGQRLPIDVPQAHRATLGGVIATNTSGSRRYGWGTIRDYVIGISALDASGRVFHAGGRVVKNVAGYDLCKMLIGSVGTLAVISQVTLKLRPEPASSALFWCEFESLASLEPALARLNLSATRPVAIDVLNVAGAEAVAAEAGLPLPCALPVLCVGFEGSAREVEWQLAAVQDELRPLQPARQEIVPASLAGRLWYALSDFQIPSDEPVTFKASLPPSRVMELMQRLEALAIPAQAHAGNGIVIGHLPDAINSPAAAQAQLAALRRELQRWGGRLTILYCDETWQSQLELFGSQDANWSLLQKLKQQLDPRHLLSPQRLGNPSR